MHNRLLKPIVWAASGAVATETFRLNFGKSYVNALTQFAVQKQLEAMRAVDVNRDIVVNYRSLLKEILLGCGGYVLWKSCSWVDGSPELKELQFYVAKFTTSYDTLLVKAIRSRGFFCRSIDCALDKGLVGYTGEEANLAMSAEFIRDTLNGVDPLGSLAKFRNGRSKQYEDMSRLPLPLIMKSFGFVVKDCTQLSNIKDKNAAITTFRTLKPGVYLCFCRAFSPVVSLSKDFRASCVIISENAVTFYDPNCGSWQLIKSLEHDSGNQNHNLFLEKCYNDMHYTLGGWFPGYGDYINTDDVPAYFLRVELLDANRSYIQSWIDWLAGN